MYIYTVKYTVQYIVEGCDPGKEIPRPSEKFPYTSAGRKISWQCSAPERLHCGDVKLQLTGGPTRPLDTVCVGGGGGKRHAF